MAIDLKSQLRLLLQDSHVWDTLLRVRNHYSVDAWEKAGRPVPVPHAVKQDMLIRYATTYGTQTLIETGTFYGDMVYAMRDRFEKIISIELSADLAKRAVRRFKNHPRIQIVQGDSGVLLPQILTTITTTCLFWLDAHASGGGTAGNAKEYCPVLREVNAVLGHGNKDHVILIDDAGSFNGTDCYPTLSQLREVVANSGPSYDLSVSEHVIQIHPRRNG